MGMLVNGHWSDEARSIRDGAFVRQASAYSDSLEAEDALLPGRFHLVASLSCPWS